VAGPRVSESTGREGQAGKVKIRRKYALWLCWSGKKRKDDQSETRGKGRIKLREPAG